MIHLTLTTGHMRESPRSEVSDATIAALTPLLATGQHALPGVVGYGLRVTIERGALVATVLHAARVHDHRYAIPMATVGAAADSEALEALRQLYGDAMAQVTSAPACVVELHDTLALYPHAAEWLGDLERCLAWAWVEHRRGAS